MDSDIVYLIVGNVLVTVVSVTYMWLQGASEFALLAPAAVYLSTLDFLRRRPKDCSSGANSAGN